MISDQQLRADTNNFLIVRLVLASFVLVSHAFDLASSAYGPNPTPGWFGGVSLGHVAVNGFFFLSGFLVSGSFERRNDPASFISARVARIFPGYIVNLLVTILLLGLFVTSVAPANFFTSPQTWNFFVANLSTLLPHSGTLPGVFTQNPSMPAVNGSLWTINFELACYLALCLFGALGILASKSKFYLFSAAFVTFQVVWAVVGSGLEQQFGSALWVTAFARLSLSFFLGVLAFRYRHVASVRWRDLVILTVITMAYFVIGLRTPLVDETLRALMVAQTILCVAFSTSRKGLARLDHFDISFGLYIYAFPIQQTWYAFFPDMHPLWNMALSLATAIPFALLSWRFIEKPALDLNKQFWKSRRMPKTA